MKIKIITYTVSIPLILITLLLVKRYFPDFVITRYFSTGVIIASLAYVLIGAIFGERKYLIQLVFVDDIIRLTYLTALDRKEQLFIKFDSLTEIEFKRRIFFIRDLPRIKFCSKKANQIDFYIFNSETRESSEHLAIAFSKRVIPG